MIKFLIGPLLMAVAWLVGSYYGADAEQLVHKSPEAVRAALTNIVDGSQEREATLTTDVGRKIPTFLKLAATDGAKSMSIQLLFGEQPAVSADVTLTPAEDGQATLLAVKLHSDRGVLRDKLAGTPQARLAYAPDWLLNLTFRPVLRALAEDIEKGQGIASIPGFTSRADWESSLPPERQSEVQAWRQYEATQPVVDPDAAAQNYLSSSN
ncbi:MAG TPA: hypothetical protein VM145_07685 [Sphingomicrobium sp.]|nr:hypothetical protein [Sphingomicrobium sp.]